MSVHRQSVVIASRSVFSDLREGGSIPPDLLARLRRSDMLDFIREEGSGIGASCTSDAAFIGLDREFLHTSGGATDPIAERFLSMLAGRRVVALDVVSGNEEGGQPQTVAAALARHAAIGQLLDTHGQTDQVAGTHWTLALVVCRELSEEDIEALRQVGQHRHDPRVYLLDGKLRSSKGGKFVEARNVWDQVLPGLLICLAASTPRAARGDVLAWRSLLLEPGMPPVAVAGVFSAWLRKKVLGTGETFRPPEFAAATLDPKLKDPPDPPDLHFEDPYQTGRFCRSVDQHLAPADFATLRVATADRLRVDAAEAGQVADGDVRRNESQTWGQAQSSPGHLMSMAKAIQLKQAELGADLDRDASPWKNLLAEMAVADERREAAMEVAKVVDDARSHFISWLIRMGVAIAAMLLVMYIVFILLYPLLDAAFSSWWFWIPCAAGIVGAVVATTVSWHFERWAGGVGIEKLQKSVAVAQGANASRACLRFMAKVHSRNQDVAYGEMLDHAGGLANRLQLTLDAATRSADVGPSKLQPSRSEEAVVDRRVLQDETVVTICAMDEQTARAHADATLIDHGDSLWRGLSQAWAQMGGRCDVENRGSYPVPIVQQVWERAVQHAWAEFHGHLISRVTMKWRDRELNTASSEIAKTIARMQGFGASERPFLSSRHVYQQSQEGNEVRMLLVRDAQLEHTLIEPLRRGGQKVTPKVVPNLAVFGMYFEEVPVCLNDRAGA